MRAGALDPRDVAGALPAAARDAALASEAELRRWVLPAQQLFWAVRAIVVVVLYTENHCRLRDWSSSPR